MAVSEVISSGLKPYSIGDKIRALRLRKKMGLVELGKHTGLSAALLSKLERGKLYPTLPRSCASPWSSVLASNSFSAKSARTW